MDEVEISKTLAKKHGNAKSQDGVFLSYEEANKFLTYVKNSHWWHDLYEMFYVALYFGLRRSELLGLRWSAINFKLKTMTISHTVTKGTMINKLDSTKTEANKRTYPLSDAQVNMFKRLKEREDNNRSQNQKVYHENDYIFKYPDGREFYPDHPSKVFKKIIKQHPDLPQDITFHGLRTSCVSILVHENKDIKSIQLWVGHADINTTLKIYTKVKSQDGMNDVSAAMDEKIKLDNE